MRREGTGRKVFKIRSSGHWGMAIAIFSLVFVLECVCAYVLLYLNDASQRDALSRTANAYYVLYTVPHRLAAIGFVWNPLPSILQLPLLLFAKAWPVLATHGLSGGIVTAVFAAFNAAYLYRAFVHYRQDTIFAVWAVALYTFHPFIFYYGCNGMSETPFYTAQIVCVGALLKWMENRKTIHLLSMATVLVIGFFCRYEVVPFGMGLGLAMLIVVFGMEDPLSKIRKTLAMKWHYAIATGIAIFLPVLYAVFFWIFMNWSIMDNPFYFLSSTYSNSAQTANDLTDSFVAMAMSPISAMAYMGIRLFPFIVIFLPIVVERALTRRLLKADACIYYTLILVMILFHYYLLVSGSSYGWLRFSSYAMPTVAALLPYECSKLRKVGGRVAWAGPRLGFMVGLSACFVVSGVLIRGVYFKSHELAAEEFMALYTADSSFVNTQRQVAAVINEKYGQDRILVDSVEAGGIILDLEHPENLLITSADEFEDAILEPWAYDIRYIVVINPLTKGRMDRLNNVWPNLYANGADWCFLVEDFQDVRIYALW